MAVLPFERVQEHQAVKLVYEELMSAYQDQQGVHAETILNAVGAIAGFAAQQAVWKVLIEKGRRNPGDYLVMVQSDSGDRYYFGEAINLVLTCTQPGCLSFWSFVAGAVPNPSVDTLPDLMDIFRNTAATVGGELFAVPRVPEKHLPRELPVKALKRNWANIQLILDRTGGDPMQWPALLGVVANILIRQIGDQLTPALAARIIMESAVPMSKINPQAVPGAIAGTKPTDKWSVRAAQESSVKDIYKEVRKAMPAALSA